MRGEGTVKVIRQGVKADICRNRNRFSKLFKPDPELPRRQAIAQAKQQAKAWLEAKRKEIPPVKLPPMRHKGTDLVRGVSLTRSVGNRTYGYINIRYSVCLKEAGKTVFATFMVGPEGKVTDEDIAVVRSVAEACRAAYLHSLATGTPFDRRQWTSQWRERFGVELTRTHGKAALRHPRLLARAARGEWPGQGGRSQAPGRASAARAAAAAAAPAG